MKVTVVKLVVFIFVSIVLQYIVTQFFYAYPAPESVKKLNQYQSQQYDIVYFGDSSVTWYSKDDTDIRSTAALLQSQLGKTYRVGQITHDSYNAGMYRAYTNYMVQQQYYPRYIIVPINLRSFSTEWNLRAQFVDEQLYLKFYNTPLNPFLNFLVNITLPDAKRLSDNLFAFTPVYDGNTIVGNGKQFESYMKAEVPEKVRIPKMSQLFYLGTIAPNHNRLTDFVTIAKRYKETNTKVIFYVTPVDYQTGQKYFGSHLSKQVKQNIQTITQELKKYDATVLDLSFTQPSKNFTWREVWYINEHLNQKGRASIAEKLAEVFKSF